MLTQLTSDDLEHGCAHRVGGCSYGGAFSKPLASKQASKRESESLHHTPGERNREREREGSVLSAEPQPDAACCTARVAECRLLAFSLWLVRTFVFLSPSM